jgi:hypothetical protein
VPAGDLDLVDTELKHFVRLPFPETLRMNGTSREMNVFLAASPDKRSGMKPMKRLLVGRSRMRLPSSTADESCSGYNKSWR